MTASNNLDKVMEVHLRIKTGEVDFYRQAKEEAKEREAEEKELDEWATEWAKTQEHKKVARYKPKPKLEPVKTYQDSCKRRLKSRVRKLPD